MTDPAASALLRQREQKDDDSESRVGHLQYAAPLATAGQGVAGFDHFHGPQCYAMGPGDTEVLICHLKK